jgi:hypothetical protein
VFALGTLPVVLFLWVGQAAAGRGRDAPFTVAAALVLGAGMSLHNARAVCEGLGGTVGDWARTPKSGDGLARARGPGYAPPRGRAGAGELALAAWCVGTGALALATGEAHALPFLALLGAGFGAVGAACRRTATRGG